VEVLHDGFLKVIRAANGHEIIQATDSVVMLIYVANWDFVVFTKQFRVAARHSDYNPTGEVLELPAGRFDEEGLTVFSLAQKEAREEVGIDLSGYELELIYPDPLTVCAGILTERTWLVYAEVLSFDVEKDDRIFGVDGEQIERVFLPVNYLREDFVPQAMSDAAAINWFLRTKRGRE
jgi:8-oxo-dGTP pyrophosphatase MutT (NUDIX family)